MGLGDDERLPVAPIEPFTQIAGQLQVLALILADRHGRGLVEQDVSRLQDGVGEQPHTRGPGLRLPRLVLELGHPPGLPETGEALHHPAELGMLRHVALHEY